MPLDIPILDDRRWADLVGDAVARIPRLAPRWTDHNVHDPGITFIELFAWLAEMQIYQLDRVGTRHREMFARLAGAPRRTRTPARVDIIASGTLTASVLIPRETQLVPVEGGKEVVFETIEDVRLTRSELKSVVVDDGTRAIDQTIANSKFGIAFLAFGEHAPIGAQLRLGFDRLYPEEENVSLAIDMYTADLETRCGSDLPVTSSGSEWPIRMLAQIVRGNGKAASIAEADRRIAQPVELTWEYLGPADRWLPLTLVKDETEAFSRSGAVTLRIPADAKSETQAFLRSGSAAVQTVVDSALKRAWLRCRIVRGAYDIEPRLRHIGVNALPCVQRETVRDELLKKGDGRPDQSFVLAKGPILLSEEGLSFDSLQPGDAEEPVARDDDAKSSLTQQPETSIQIEVGDELWQRVSSFDDAGPDSKQYVFDADNRLVLFGNGLNGRVPMPGQDVRARLYRTCQGKAGNVAKDLQWKFRTPIVPGVELRNPEPASGGADTESLDEMELRAKALLSRPYRAVTTNDIERLALGTPHVHVARAVAIPGCPVPEAITVVVVPKSRPGRAGPPNQPSDAFMGAVRTHLQRRRLLCDNLRVVGPTYVEVRVSARLRLEKKASATAVIERARLALDRFFAGEDMERLYDEPTDTSAARTPCPTRWPFGRSVYPSEIYAALRGAKGVDAVSGLSLAGRKGDRAVAPDNEGAIAIPRIGLVFPGTHELTIDASNASRG